jgi:DNA-binding NarL/FixJ family response regulator
MIVRRKKVFRPRRTIFPADLLVERHGALIILGMKDSDLIRLALFSRFGLFRDGLGKLLASEPDLEIVCTCAPDSQAWELLTESKADMAILDGSCGSGDFTHAARKAGYGGKVLLVTDAIDAAQAASALRSGVAGIFLKCQSSDRLLQAIRLVASGEAWVDQEVIQQLAERYPQHEDRRLANLTARERAVIKGLLDGLTNREIGRRIDSSEATVKATLQNLFGKTGVRTRSQLVRAVLQNSIPVA